MGTGPGTVPRDPNGQLAAGAPVPEETVAERVGSFSTAQDCGAEKKGNTLLSFFDISVRWGSSASLRGSE